MKNRISTGALFAMLILMAMLPRTGHSQEIDPNAYYEIVSSNNLVLDNQDSEDDGTQIFINNRVENRVSQVWQLTTPGHGVYKICTPLSDKCVDNNNTKEPGPVIQWDNGATNMNQFWKLTKIGGNTYTFTNITNGLNLGISDDGQPGKAALQLVADSTSARQHWTLRRSNIKIDKEALRSSSDKDWENETILAGAYDLCPLPFRGKPEKFARLSQSLASPELAALPVVERQLEIQLGKTAVRTSGQFL